MRSVLQYTLTALVLGVVTSSISTGDETIGKRDSSAKGTNKTGGEVVAGQKTQAATKEEIAQIDGWIQDLSNPALSVRRKARKQLAEAGSKAIPQLSRAAVSGERDVTIYAIEALGEIAGKSANKDAREAAKVTLELLAEHDQPRVAELAAKMLKAGKASENSGRLNGKKAAAFAGDVQGSSRSVSVSSINGAKTIRIEQDGRLTTFTDEAGGRIRVVTDDGKDQREFVADDLDDLLKQDPAAHALYTEQSNGVGGFSFARGGGGPGPAFQFQNSGPGKAMSFSSSSNGTDSKQARQSMIRQLKDLQQQMADNPAISEALSEQIKALEAEK